MTFGERLKHARTRAGLTAYALGKRTAIAAETIRRIERGQCDPQLSTAIVLAAGVGEHLHELTGPLPVLPEYVPRRAGRKRKD
jgi:DNA-binding XRE family transcriptional regulator